MRSGKGGGGGGGGGGGQYGLGQCVRMILMEVMIGVLQRMDASFLGLSICLCGWFGEGGVVQVWMLSWYQWNTWRP